MRLFVLAILVSFSSFSFGQGYYQRNEGYQFISLSAGLGSNHWRAMATDYSLWDPRGNKIVDDESSSLTTQTYSDLYEIEILFPVEQWRIGGGLNFELFTLLNVELHTEQGSQQHGFPEVFSANKLFVHAERPILQSRNENFEWNAGVKAGKYVLSMVNSTSLFGENRFGATWFGEVHTGIQFRVIDYLYACAYGFTDYKYFDNTKLESPQDIRYHIMTYGAAVSVRYAFR